MAIVRNREIIIKKTMNSLKIRNSKQPPLSEVMEWIIYLADKGTKDVRIRNLAIQITQDVRRDYTGNPNRRDNQAIAESIYQWMQSNIAYVHDPHMVERLLEPWVIVQEKAGDCDDHCILAGSLLQSLGVPVRFVTVAVNPQHPSVHTHIYIQYNHEQQWKAFDSTEPQLPGTPPPAVIGKPSTIWSMNGEKTNSNALHGLSTARPADLNEDQQLGWAQFVLPAFAQSADIFSGGPRQREREAKANAVATGNMIEIERLRLEQQREMVKNAMMYAGIAAALGTFGIIVYNVAR